MQFPRASSQRTSWSRCLPLRQPLGRQPEDERFSCALEVDDKHLWARRMPSHASGETDRLKYHRAAGVGAQLVAERPGDLTGRRP